MSFRPKLTGAIFAAFAAFAAAQLQGAPFTITLTDNPALLASTLLGPGTSIAGIPTLTATPGQSGIFTDFSSGPYTQTGGATGLFSLASGVILSTGIASAAEGNYIGGPSFDASGTGDSTLASIAGNPVFDAAVLTIPFTSTNSSLMLSFVFASTEYPSSVGSTFADPLAIFVNGANVALVPGSAMPISINSINAGVNSNYFTQYSTAATPFNYGGVTTVLTAVAPVSTSSVNTLRIAIADFGDGSLDSAVLVRGGSVAAVPEPSTWLSSAAGCALLVFAGFRRRKAQTES